MSLSPDGSDFGGSVAGWLMPLPLPLLAANLAAKSKRREEPPSDRLLLLLLLLLGDCVLADFAN